METKNSDFVIWAVSSGRAGEANAALGLAEAVARRIPARIVERQVAPRAPFVWAPAALWTMIPPREGGWPFAALGGGLHPPWPSLAIGAGRRAAPAIAAMVGLGLSRGVQVMDPHIPPARFDMMVVPAHDRLEAPNVISITGGPHRVTPERLAAADASRFGALPRPLVAVLLGGATKRGGVDSGAVNALCEGLRRLAGGGAGFAVTPSRRTPAALTEAVRRAIPQAWIWDGTGENPYFAMLSAADAIVVTGDSAAMMTEAAATRAPVHIAAMGNAGRKLAALGADLAERGIARAFSGEPFERTAPPLLETDRAAVMICRHLGLEPAAAHRT